MKPRLSYIICVTPRSGSTLLSHALRNTGFTGEPREYGLSKERLSRGTERKLQLIAKDPYGHLRIDSFEKAFEYGMTPNGVFGCVMTWQAFNNFYNQVRKITNHKNMPAPELIPMVFPNLRYIYLSRRDKVSQAVSLAKGTQTKIWAWFKDKPPSYEKEPVFNTGLIDHCLDQIIKFDVAWQKYFKRYGIKPFKVVYEDLVADSESVTLDILKYLDTPIPKNFVSGEILLKKQADAVSMEWVKKYRPIWLRRKIFSVTGMVIRAVKRVFRIRPDGQ